LLLFHGRNDFPRCSVFPLYLRLTVFEQRVLPSTSISGGVLAGTTLLDRKYIDMSIINWFLSALELWTWGAYWVGVAVKRKCPMGVWGKVWDHPTTGY